MKAKISNNLGELYILICRQI